MEALVEQPPAYRPLEELRKYDDVTTLFAEMVDGNMRTPIELSYRDGEFYSRDGEAMGEVFYKSLAEADRIADAKPNLAFEVRRRRWEIDEYHDMLKMAAGDLPNTTVAVSDFPAELMEARQDVGGYNAERKPTMLRVLNWDGQRMRMYTQTLDGSNRQALEMVYGALGAQPRRGELLGQRVHLQLGPEEQELLTDRLTAAYDQSLRQQFGGNWFAGRFDGSRINTYDFVREQRDIVQLALQQQRQGALDIYGLAATLQARFAHNRQVQPDQILTRVPDPFHNLHAEIQREKQQAAVTGKVFNACGVTMEQLNSSLDEELGGAGYGNKTSGSTDYSFDKKMYCVICQAPPPEKAVKKFCGPCGICIDCDRTGRASRAK